jgi:NACHT NTPase-like protein
MDALTAVGFAANLIAFVDFAWDLVSGAAELYKSPTGRTIKNAHVENVISDLQDVTDDLDTGSLGDSKEAKRLRRLASSCNELAEELLALLKRLRLDGNKNRPWASLIVKWRNMRKANEVASMEERLREYRSEILLQLNIMLRWVYISFRLE